MMKIRILQLLVFSLVVFFLASPVKAEQVKIWDNHTENLYNNSNYGGYGIHQIHFKADYTSYAGLMWRDNDTFSPRTVNIRLCKNDDTLLPDSYFCQHPLLLATATLEISANWFSYEFDRPVSTLQGQWYDLWVSGVSMSSYIYPDDPLFYPNNLTFARWDNDWTPLTNNYLPVIRLYHYYVDFQIRYPQAGLAYKDFYFDSFVFEYKFPSSGYDMTPLKIVYGETPSAMFNHSDALLPYSDYITDFTVPKNVQLPDGTYWVNWELYSTSTPENQIASGSPFSFYIDNANGLIIPQSGLSTSTLEQAPATFWEKLARSLFVPDPSVVNDIKDFSDKVMKKPPLGYFTAVNTTFGLLENQDSLLDLDLTQNDFLDNFKLLLNVSFSALVLFHIIKTLRKIHI